MDLPTLPLIPYEFSCSGTEQSLLDCYKYPINCYSLHYYFYYTHGGVTCQSIIYFYFFVYLFVYFVVKCKHGDIRLAGTSYSTIGRVEVCLNGTWGTICSNSFDDKDASVVCKQLGYSPYG